MGSVSELRVQMASRRRRLAAHSGVKTILGAQKELLASSAMTVREASLAFDETIARLAAYDKRLAALEAQSAKRKRWRVHVAFLKALEQEEAQQRCSDNDDASGYGSYEDDEEDEPALEALPCREKAKAPAKKLPKKELVVPPLVIPPAPSAEAVRAARRAELAAARQALCAAERVLRRPSSPKKEDSFPDLLNRFVFGSGNDAREEAAGWLHEKHGETKWTRRWFVLKIDDLGPFLEIAAAPGSRALGRVLLAGAQVHALTTDDDDSGAFFAFCVSHPHQRRRDLSCVNLQTRQQWVSVLSQLVRDHAKLERAKEASFLADDNDKEADKGAKLKRHKAKQRLAILQARAQADDAEDDRE